jgi:hypothetical protein
MPANPAEHRYRVYREKVDSDGVFDHVGLVWGHDEQDALAEWLAEQSEEQMIGARFAVRRSMIQGQMVLFTIESPKRTYNIVRA